MKMTNITSNSIKIGDFVNFKRNLLKSGYALKEVFFNFESSLIDGSTMSLTFDTPVVGLTLTNVPVKPQCIELYTSKVRQSLRKEIAKDGYKSLTRSQMDIVIADAMPLIKSSFENTFKQSSPNLVALRLTMDDRFCDKHFKF